MTAITNLPTGRTGRLLALAILFAMLAVLYAGVVAPALASYSEREAILATDRQLEPRLRAAIAEVPRLRATVAELRQTANASKVTLDGASDALASAGLQSRVERLAAAAGVAIASTEVLPAENLTAHRRIGLRMAVSGTYEGIVKLLGAIETSTPPLVLDNLQIHGKLQGTAQLAAPQLDTGFTVYGFRGNQTPTVTMP